MARGQSLQDPFLNVLRWKRIPVSAYLADDTKLQDQTEPFDQFVILLKNAISQVTYKHTISTVVPSHPVSHHGSNVTGGTDSSYHHGSNTQGSSARQDSGETEQGY